MPASFEAWVTAFALDAADGVRPYDPKLFDYFRSLNRPGAATPIRPPTMVMADDIDRLREWLKAISVHLIYSEPSAPGTYLPCLVAAIDGTEAAVARLRQGLAWMRDHEAGGTEH